jgi:hypothetical protein
VCEVGASDLSDPKLYFIGTAVGWGRTTNGPLLMNGSDVLTIGEYLVLASSS